METEAFFFFQQKKYYRLLGFAFKNGQYFPIWEEVYE